MIAPRRIVLIGGGLAAVRCAQALRSAGHDGAITLVAGERHLPYDRPPLSKGVLTGDPFRGQLDLRPPAWYAEQRIDLRIGQRARELRPAERRVELDGGSELRYDRLLIATGAQPRGAPRPLAAAGAHVLRTRDDAERLRDALRSAGSVAIVGGGLIGLEVASSARRLGLEVAVAEAGPRLLGRALPPPISHWLADLHVRAGVRVLLGSRLDGYDPAGRELLVADGRRVPAEVLVLATGVEPVTGWLRGSGALTGGALRVDAGGRTRVPDVHAAGDVAVRVGPDGREHRCDHWEAAAHSARAAAAAMLGVPLPAVTPPAFWTDQHGVRVQVVGEASDADQAERHGDPLADFHVVLRREGRVVAGVAANRPRELPALRRLITNTPTEKSPA